MKAPISFLAFPDRTDGPLQRTRTPVFEVSKSDEYFPNDALIAAVDAAMLLGIPLLLTGEPGSGKTRAAYWLSGALREDAQDGSSRLLRSDVKSTMSGRDLLYRFDEVGRFRDSAPGATPRPLIDYIEFEALGEAIVRAGGGQARLTPLGLRDPAEISLRAFGREDGGMRAADLLPGDRTFSYALPECRVVLIDELDKAPRDAPNDLLAEIENMAFNIPELGVRVDSRGHGSDLPDQRPIVIITSNSERDLPEPFLRRCAYCHIDIPGKDDLKKIVRSAIRPLENAPDHGLLDSAVEYLFVLRKSPLSRVPGTAEFLSWCARLSADDLGLQFDRGLHECDAEQHGKIVETLGLLVKSQGDLTLARQRLPSLGR